MDNDDQPTYVAVDNMHKYHVQRLGLSNVVIIHYKRMSVFGDWKEESHYVVPRVACQAIGLQMTWLSNGESGG